MHWISGLDLQAIDGGHASFAVRPEQAQVQNFITTARQGQLAQLLTELLGRPMRVRIQRIERSAPRPTPTGESGPDPEAITDLPMARQIMETFDVSLVDLRREDAFDDTASQTAGDDDPDSPDDDSTLEGPEA